MRVPDILRTFPELDLYVMLPVLVRPSLACGLVDVGRLDVLLGVLEYMGDSALFGIGLLLLSVCPLPLYELLPFLALSQ